MHIVKDIWWYQSPCSWQQSTHNCRRAFTGLHYWMVSPLSSTFWGIMHEETLYSIFYWNRIKYQVRKHVKTWNIFQPCKKHKKISRHLLPTVAITQSWQCVCVDLKDEVSYVLMQVHYNGTVRIHLETFQNKPILQSSHSTSIGMVHSLVSTRFITS